LATRSGPESPVTVGVVTPSLNAERWLRDTLESIWSQRSDRILIDHVLVDGGSSDRTVEIAKEYPTRTVVSTDDQGMYDAINKGMAMVEGDLLCYINADDEIAAGAIRVVADAFADHADAGWLCGRVEYTDGEGNVIGRMKPVPMSLRSYIGIGWSCIPQQTVWIRRSFWERVGPYDIGYRNTGDYDWYARAMGVQQPLILNATLGRFRLHEAMLSMDLSKMDREAAMVWERNGGRDSATAVVGKLLSLRLNAANLDWFIGKRTGRIKFTPS
jgi:glycosyltransferase involved in cell wall biosynthesis